MAIIDVVCFLIIYSLAVTRIGSQSLYFCDTNGLDPCEIANSREPFEPKARFVNCNYDTYSQYCDRYITPGWYKYFSNMLDRCPNLLNCGALYPVWLNGAHPTSVNTEVIRTACKVGFSNCCDKQVTIKIRHCGQYMAYCLPALDSCPERYCFGESGDCNATSESVSSTSFVQSTTSSQSTKTSTQRTTLTQFTVSESSSSTQPVSSTTQSTTSTQPTSSTTQSTTSTQPISSTTQSTTSTQTTSSTTQSTTSTRPASNTTQSTTSTQSTSSTTQSTTSTQPTSSTTQSATSIQPTSSTTQSTTSTRPASSSTQSTTSASTHSINSTGQSRTSTQLTTDKGDQSVTSTSISVNWTSSATKTSNIVSTTPSLNEQCSQDPCDPRSIENIPNFVNRSKECVFDSTLRPCDLEIKSVWYTGFRLLNKCPDFLRCGAVYPVWMNGSEPEVKDGIVTRQACKVAPNDCCAEKFEIRVVNCSLFTAYCLRPLRQCEERYCFDTKTCSTKQKNQEISAEGDDSSTTYIILAVVATIIVIIIAFVLIFYQYIKRCRSQSNDTYESPIKAQPENEYEMPVTSHVNHGNVYDELPSIEEDTDYQKLPEEEHYETMKE